MIRRIALTLCASVAVLAGAARSPASTGGTASTASAGTAPTEVVAHSASRSGYIVASS
jgi:hypothetical protein